MVRPYDDGVSKQKRHDPVVSVRLPRVVLERLTRLSKATGRSRGVYLRLAMVKMLPLLEQRYGSDLMATAREREQAALDAEFGQIIASLGGDPADLRDEDWIRSRPDDE